MPDAIPPLPPATPPLPPSQQPPQQQQLSPEEKNARTWNMLCHLSALCGYLGVPLGNVIGPLVVWQIKKNEIPSVDRHGKAALNFQLTVLIAALVFGGVGFLTLVFCVGILFCIIAGIIFVFGLIFAVIAGINANDGKEFKYPYSFTFV